MDGNKLHITRAGAMCPRFIDHNKRLGEYSYLLLTKYTSYGPHYVFSII